MSWVTGNGPRHGFRLPISLPTKAKTLAKPLTVKTLENLKPAACRREIADGAVSGLYLIVQPSGGQSWACRYRVAGRSRKLTIGRYPAVDLRTARDLAREALRKVAVGTDPGIEKKAAKKAALNPAVDLVDAVAARFVATHVRRNLKPATAYEAERILE